MDIKDLLEAHPLPWKQNTFLVNDANGREVIHTGGSTRKAELTEVVTRFLVESANASVRCPRCGIGRDTDGDGNCIMCHGKTLRELAAIKGTSAEIRDLRHKAALWDRFMAIVNESQVFELPKPIEILNKIADSKP